MSTEKMLGSRRVARWLAIAMLVVGLSSTMAGAAAKDTLRWKFKAGETLHYSMETTTVSTGQDPSGREVKRSFTLITDMTWTTKAVDSSGLASLNQTIDRVRVTVTSPGSKISTDSKEAGDGDSLFGPMFKILVGAEFFSKMNVRGELTEIKLADKLLAEIGGANEGGGPKGQFSEEGLKNILSQMVVPLPEAGVAVGETWVRKMTVPTDVEGQTRQIEQIFTYKGPEAASPGLVVIDFTTKMEAHKPDPRIPIVYKQETAAGRFDFDNVAGRIARSNSTEIVEVSVTIQGKEAPQKRETTRVLMLSKDKAP
jgi:Family of unknown function (DUF6263)